MSQDTMAGKRDYYQVLEIKQVGLRRRHPPLLPAIGPAVPP